MSLAAVARGFGLGTAMDLLHRPDQSRPSSGPVGGCGVCAGLPGCRRCATAGAPSIGNAHMHC